MLQQNQHWGRQRYCDVSLFTCSRGDEHVCVFTFVLQWRLRGVWNMSDCSLLALRVFQSRWRWRRRLPRDSGLSAPFALPLCHPGSVPACCLWQWRGCLALPCQPNVVRYRWLICCLHIPRVLQTFWGKCPLKVLSGYLVALWFTSPIYFLFSIFLFNAEYSEEIWLHHTFICSLSWGEAPANGKSVPQLPRSHDVSLPVSHCAAGCWDGEAVLHGRL